MSLRKLIGLVALSLITLSACHKDLGDYEINMPATPEVVNLDSVYTAIVGDSLIIKPTINNTKGDDIELQWRISVMTGNDVKFTGPALKIIFGLEAQRYTARLTVYNKTNGMKYFHDFFVDGGTEFGSGTAVLSSENGITQFSFIKPNGEVQARLYHAMQGKDLPKDPLNLFLMKNTATGGTLLGYWIITKGGGVRLNANTMQEDPKYPNTIADNYFSAPDNLVVNELKQHPQGILAGVISNVLTYGTTNTWDQSPTYGMFSAAEGEYQLAPSFIMNFNQNQGTYFIGFERNLKQFVRLNVYNGPTYFGTQYDTESTAVFDPKNVGMDLIHMEQLNGSECFAYCKRSDGKVYELSFNVKFTGPFTFSPLKKRLFIRQELITEKTKWQGAKNGIIYLASGNKVYRYNPINEDVRELSTDFGDAEVTMIRLSENEETIMVGVAGSIYYLDISTGKLGTFLKKIDGIPGSPVDVAIR